MPTPPPKPQDLPLTPPFGELVRNYRLMRGLSVEQVAEAARLAPSAVRAMEGGARLSPAQESVNALADVFQLNTQERELFRLAAMLDSPAMRGLMGLVTGEKAEQPAAAPVLPAAILVFLIADVRGYTRFTQERGDEGAARLATKFAEICRAAAERWDGRVIELRGDEALAVFGSVRQALRAALDLQERFARESAADAELPLPVGIGVDVGEAMPVEEGYRGAALNRAARLCSQAGAGDVLVTAGLVYVAPKVEGVAFVPRGRVALKGFDEPVEVLAVTRAEETGSEGSA